MLARQSAAPDVQSLMSDAGRETQTHKVVVELYGTDRCHGTQFCKVAFETRKVAYVYRNLDTDVAAAGALQDLYAPSPAHFPTVRLGDVVLNNPSLSEFDRELERQSIIEPTLYHCAEQLRYFMYLAEGEAFVSYRDKEGVRYLDHTFVPTKFRGNGLGKRLIVETLKRLCKDGQKTRISCPFIEGVARQARDEAILYLQNSGLADTGAMSVLPQQRERA